MIYIISCFKCLVSSLKLFCSLDCFVCDVMWLIILVFADKDDSKFLTHDEMEKIMMCSYGVQFDGTNERTNEWSIMQRHSV